MSKQIRPTQPLILFLLLLALGSTTLSARIGESRRDLEERLLRESDRGLEVTDDDLEAFHRSRSPVFAPLRVLEGEDIQYIIYYKSSDDLIPSSLRLWREDNRGKRSDRPEDKPEGWMLHTVYLNGISVLEFYSRSKPLTELESEGILLRNTGNSRWVKGRVPQNNESAIQPKTFPVNHYREDFGIYANVTGDSVLLFDPRLDQMIESHRLEKAKEEAPDSLEGF
jgi:hypothetical protein